jgi:hypothetical protein
VGRTVTGNRWKLPVPEVRHNFIHSTINLFWNEHDNLLGFSVEPEEAKHPGVAWYIGVFLWLHQRSLARWLCVGVSLTPSYSYTSETSTPLGELASAYVTDVDNLGKLVFAPLGSILLIPMQLYWGDKICTSLAGNASILLRIFIADFHSSRGIQRHYRLSPHCTFSGIAGFSPPNCLQQA